MKLFREHGDWILCVLVMGLYNVPLPASGDAYPTEAEYYGGPKVYNDRPEPDRRAELGPIGVTGIEARIQPRVSWSRWKRRSRAHRRRASSTRAISSSGSTATALKGRNPYVVLGSALTEAEATDGVLTFDVKAGGRRRGQAGHRQDPGAGRLQQDLPAELRESRRRSSSRPPSSIPARTG